MPSTRVFYQQDPTYRESVLLKAVIACAAIKASIADDECKYVGLNEVIVGITRFGKSAPAEQLCEGFLLYRSGWGEQSARCAVSNIRQTKESA